MFHYDHRWSQKVTQSALKIQGNGASSIALSVNVTDSISMPEFISLGLDAVPERDICDRASVLAVCRRTRREDAAIALGVEEGSLLLSGLDRILVHATKRVFPCSRESDARNSGEG